MIVWTLWAEKCRSSCSRWTWSTPSKSSCEHCATIKTLFFSDRMCLRNRLHVDFCYCRTFISMSDSRSIMIFRFLGHLDLWCFFSVLMRERELEISLVSSWTTLYCFSSNLTLLLPTIFSICFNFVYYSRNVSRFGFHPRRRCSPPPCFYVLEGYTVPSIRLTLTVESVHALAKFHVAAASK